MPGKDLDCVISGRQDCLFYKAGTEHRGFPEMEIYSWRIRVTAYHETAGVTTAVQLYHTLKVS